MILKNIEYVAYNDDDEIVLSDNCIKSMAQKTGHTSGSLSTMICRKQKIMIFGERCEILKVVI